MPGENPGTITNKAPFLVMSAAGCLPGTASVLAGSLLALPSGLGRSRDSGMIELAVIALWFGAFMWNIHVNEGKPGHFMVVLLVLVVTAFAIVSV